MTVILELPYTCAYIYIYMFVLYIDFHFGAVGCTHILPELKCIVGLLSM